MTLAASEAQGKVALAKLKEMFGDPFTKDMELSFNDSMEDADGNPYCEISWQTGPFGWAYISPQDGGEADGVRFAPVHGWPSEMWIEARDAYAVRVWVES